MRHHPACPINTRGCLADPPHPVILDEPYPMCDTCLSECHCATIAKVLARRIP